MSLTLPLIGLTTLVGYFFNKDGKNPRNIDTVRNNISTFDKPNGDNIYSSNKVEEVNAEMLQRSLNNYKLAENPAETGVLPPLFNTYGLVGNDSVMSPILNTEISGMTSQQLGKLNDINRLKNVSNNVDNQDIDTMPMFKSKFNREHLDESNFKFSDIQGNVGNVNVNTLTGLPFEVDHNNMVPFFGGTVKQNMETFSNQSLLDNRTGNTSTFEHKKEIASLYDKSPENIYGNPVFATQVDTDRYIPSLYRQNERPVEPIYVSAPKEGTFDNKIRPEYKDVNELRPGNNPKETYTGRIIPGQRGEVRGIQAEVVKRRPETFYNKTADHLFKGPGEFIAPKANEDYSENMKSSSRQSYNMEYYGTVNTSNSNKTIQRIKSNVDNSDELASALFQDPKRQTFENDYTRNITASILEKSTNDYGKSGMVQYESERSSTGEKTYLLNANKTEMGLRLRPQDDIKTTLKENMFTDNSGYIKTTFDKTSTLVYDMGISDMTAKQTQKQTLIDNKYTGQVQNENGMGYLVNKYEAKTTGKELITNQGDFVANPNKIVKNGKIYSTYDNQEKVRNAIHTEYTSNPNYNSEMASRDKYNNAEIRNEKQILISGERPSGPQQFQIASGKVSFADIKETNNMKLKEELDNRDKMNVNVSQVIPDKNILGYCEKGRFEYDHNPRLNINNTRFEPELITSQLNKNPYVINSSKHL